MNVLALAGGAILLAASGVAAPPILAQTAAEGALPDIVVTAASICSAAAPMQCTEVAQAELME